jgi:hypothetical protein
MIETGNFTEDFTLGSLAASGSPEDENGAISIHVSSEDISTRVLKSIAAFICTSR